jgi:hypothetical protein
MYKIQITASELRLQAPVINEILIFIDKNANLAIIRAGGIADEFQRQSFTGLPGLPGREMVMCIPDLPL